MFPKVRMTDLRIIAIGVSTCVGRRGGQAEKVLLQIAVLGFRLLQDGDVGIGVFPESKEVFVSSERSNAGSIGIHTALRFSEWALEFMIVPPYCFVRSRRNQFRLGGTEGETIPNAPLEALQSLGSFDTIFIQLKNGQLNVSGLNTGP